MISCQNMMAMKIKNTHVNFPEAENQCGPQDELLQEVENEFNQVDDNSNGRITWAEL